jgi:glucarate dehydratase
LGQVRIKRAEVTSVAIPLQGRLLHSDGAFPPWQVRHILRLETDAGIAGVGDASPRVDGRALQRVAEALVGKDPFNLQDIHLALNSQKFYRMDEAAAAAAIQMACLDIQGRCLDRPVADLLGGQLRDRVPVIAYLFRKSEVDGRDQINTPEAVVAEAKRMVDRYGFGTLKYKAGAVSPEEDVETALALRAAFPEHRLRVDPNAAWGLPTALRVARQLRDIDLEWLEDPTAGLRGMSEFRRRSDIPTATNMCCIQPREFAAAVHARAFDVMLLDLWYLCGPWSAYQMAYACAVFDVGVGIHAGGGSSETGIGLAAQAQLAAALPSLVHGIDTMHLELVDDVIDQPGWSYENGDLLLPRAAGLGVELDEDRMSRHAATYRELARSGALSGPTTRHPSYPLY